MLKRILSIILVVAAIASFAMPVSAANFADAVDIGLDQSYYREWTPVTKNENHYMKFTIPSQGVVTITADKPIDSNGNPGVLEFAIYEATNNRYLLWDCDTYEACNDSKDYYLLNVGLAAGTYYLVIGADFKTITSLMYTNLSVSFEADDYCEIEPNEYSSQCTRVELNETYRGWFGNDGAYLACTDNFQFNVVAGKTYRITWLDYENFSGTDVDFCYDETNRGVTVYNDYLDWYVDHNGDHYYEFTPRSSGTVRLYLRGYRGKQIAYHFNIRLATCANGHAFKNTVTYPTVSANGYTTRTCTVCGYNYVENYTFPDVRNNAWYYNAVEFAVREGYFSGYKSGNFGPGDEITRQDFVVVLARIEGVNLAKYSGRTSFKDVPAGSYYEAAIKWASTTGVVAGYNAVRFGVNDKLTREQLVTILYRYAQKKGCNMSVTAASKAKLKSFSDGGKVSSYAQTACAWALQNGVISGLNAATFGPQRNANRAQVATILMNIAKNKVIPF